MQEEGELRRVHVTAVEPLVRAGLWVLPHLLLLVLVCAVYCGSERSMYFLGVCIERRGRGAMCVGGWRWAMDDVERSIATAPFSHSLYDERLLITT